MNIGITSSSAINPYASTIISKLTAQSDKPTCIISTQTSKIVRLKNQIRKTGCRLTMKKILHHFNIVQDRDKNCKCYLREYALSNNVTGWDLPLSTISKKERIEYIRVSNINSKEAVDSVKNKDIDILINAGGGIFKNDIINAPRIGILNAHMGFLPTFRGMNVLEWSLFYGHKIGVTLHFIERGIDTGDILLFKEIPIERGDSISTLREKSIVINVELMIQAINLLKCNSATRIKQQLGQGKQYFVMHRKLKVLVDRNLHKTAS